MLLMSKNTVLLYIVHKVLETTVHCPTDTRVSSLVTCYIWRNLLSTYTTVNDCLIEVNCVIRLPESL